LDSSILEGTQTTVASSEIDVDRKRTSVMETDTIEADIISKLTKKYASTDPAFITEVIHTAILSLETPIKRQQLKSSSQEVSQEEPTIIADSIRMPFLRLLMTLRIPKRERTVL
jgi:hypothetical protein